MRNNPLDDLDLGLLAEIAALMFRLAGQAAHIDPALLGDPVVLLVDPPDR